MMIRFGTPITHPALPGIQVFLINGEILERGKQQQVLVQMSPGSEIPMHKHNCNAQMFVVSGKAIVQADDPELAGKEVGIGAEVFFSRCQNHGFRASSEGMSFLSTNDGIVDMDVSGWDLQFCH